MIETRNLTKDFGSLQVLRGISETGVPTIETEWVPPSKQSEIGPTFTKIAKPTLQCMFEPSTNE